MLASRRLGLPLTHPVALIGTFFGVGLIPVAPGTFGSLAALPVAWLVRDFAGETGLALACAIFFAAGWWASSQIVQSSGMQDPQFIVIDEVAAEGLLLLAIPQSLLGYGIAFLCFRLFDIVKPPPARSIERNVEGGLGVMLDDLIAAGYAFALFFLLLLIGRASGVVS